MRSLRLCGEFILIYSNQDIMNIYEQQRHNRRATYLLMFIFILVFCVLGFGFDQFFTGGLPIGTTVALIIATISVLGSYYAGAKVVLYSTGARAVNMSNLKERQFHNIVEEVSIAGGLPMPKVYIVPDPDPNAFATGRNPQHASIAITEGLLEKLNRDEIQGVVAHEMSHISNYDIRLMTVIAALVGAIVLLSDFSARSMRYIGRSKGKGKALGIVPFIIWLLLIILAPIIAQIMAMAISRKREYLADATGAELIRNPLALASALEKIEQDVAATKSIKRGVAHLCIADPLGRSFTNKQGFIANLFATHPPMQERITRLKKMGYIYAPTIAHGSAPTV
ncbi:MAG: M48 family metallopeptidase [Planctomycetota bacterium]|nr:M48 family metallopeptidase [Planctomycetota bacterium]